LSKGLIFLIEVSIIIIVIICSKLELGLRLTVLRRGLVDHGVIICLKFKIL
jgi:hypothetical protein